MTILIIVKCKLMLSASRWMRNWQRQPVRSCLLLQ